MYSMYKYQRLLIVCINLVNHNAFPVGSDGKESACNAEDLDSIPGLGRSPGEGNGNPLQYSCLENPTYRGAWQAALHAVTESDVNECLSLTLVI